MDASRFAPHPLVLPLAAKAIGHLGRFYNRYQVRGLEHLPREGGALLVLYHGLVPLDFWYLGMRIFEETGRKPCALVDRWLLKTPGLAWFTRAVGGIEANFESALSVLREGHIVGVSPGGVREAIAGRRNNYKLIWRQRRGFAKLAVEANVPVIPGFTENVESLYHAPFADQPMFQKIYEKTRLPLVPIIGLGPLPFPVPLTTWLGEPIWPESAESADFNTRVENLGARTRRALEKLIGEHQTRHGQVIKKPKTLPGV